MKIKPVDNVYLGAQLPQKQKDNNMNTFKEYLSRDGASKSDKRFLENYLAAHKEWEKEGPISHNGRMVDKSRIVDGLCEIKDFITNANEERVVTDNDIAHFEEVIEAAKDYLLED
jgi:hypothetical protein